MKALASGIYTLLPVTSGVPTWPPLIGGGPASTITNVNVDGFRYRTGWKQIQPDTTGIPATDSVNYVWGAVDTAVADCTAAGKKIGISIAVGGNAPDWLYAVSPAVYQFACDPGGLVDNDPWQPLPWDTNYQARLQTFLTAFGLRYDGNPTISYVVLTGFMQLAEMNFVFTPADDVAVNQIAAVPPGGYSGLAAYPDDNRIEQQIKCILTLGSAAVTFAPDNDPNTPQFDAAWDTGIRVKASGGTTGVLQNNTHFTVVDATNGTLDKTALQSGEFPITFIARYGRASLDAYTDGVQAIVAMFVAAFPTTSLLLTYSRAFPTPPGVTTSRELKNWMTATYPGHVGMMTASLPATCPPHQPPGQLTTDPKGFQAIYPSSNILVYQGRVCGAPWPPVPPQALDDMLGNAYTQGAHYAEMYKSDIDAAISQPILAARRIQLLSNAGIGGGGGGGLTGSYEKYATTPTGVDEYWTAYTPDLLPHPAVIALHPGGYHAGVVVSEAVCVEIAAAGFFVLAAENRLAPPHLQMNSGSGHPFPGQDDVSDEGYFPEQTQDVARAIVTARADPRCNGEVYLIGGSAGASHSLFMAATGLTNDDGLEHNGYASGVIGNTRPDRVVLLSTGVANLADPNILALDCAGAESTCPHDAITNYNQIVDTWPTYTAADIEKLRIASPVTYFHSDMPPIYVLISTQDGLGIPTSTGLDLQGENGENGLIPKLQKLGWTESSEAFPEQGKYKLTIVNVSEFAHAFAYFDHPGTNPASVGPTLINPWLLAEIGGGSGVGGVTTTPDYSLLPWPYRTVRNFRDDLMYPVAALIGIDTDTTNSDLNPAMARTWTTSMNRHLRYAWEFWDWPELNVTEERAFRTPWNAFDQWFRGDEVFYITTFNYYRVNPTAVIDPPIGTLPTNLTYFTPFVLDARYIQLDQRCRPAIGQINNVWASNPLRGGYAPGLGYFPSERGIEVPGGNATVFIRYKIRPITVTAVPYSSTTNYTAGQIVYWPTDGQCYRARISGTNIPPGTSSNWELVRIPYTLSEYVVYRTAADVCDDLQSAAMWRADADMMIRREVDKLYEQGERHYLNSPVNRVLPLGVADFGWSAYAPFHN